MIIELHDGNTIEINIFNARNILLKTKSNIVNIIKSDNDIKTLLFNDNFHIELNDLFPLISDCDTKTAFLVKKITVMNNDDLSLFKISCNVINKTSHWLLPFIATNEKELNYNTILENAYLFNKTGSYNQCHQGFIFLKYKFLKEHEYFLNELKDHKNCFLVDTLYSRYEYLYIFKFPKIYLDDVELITKGKYSKISDKAKKRILTFHSLKINGKTGNILYKNQDYMTKLKKELGVDCEMNELESKFDIKSETLFK